MTELLQTFGLKDCKPASLPMMTSTRLQKTGEPLDTTVYSYSSLVGSLLYLSISTRPDITQAVGALARYLSCPTVGHWNAAITVARYLSGTSDYGLWFGSAPTSAPADTLTLHAYCDADYAGACDDRRSTTGYLFTLYGGAITWCSKRQPTVAASTTEAEYMSAAAVTKEALWLRTLCADMGFGSPCIEVFCDNQAALHLIKNTATSQRSKHIQVHHHFLRERVARGEVTFTYVPTADMLADILTKPLPTSKLRLCRDGMGVR